MKKSLLFILAIVLSFSTFAQDFSEDFSTVTVDSDITLDGWTNTASDGTRVFIGKFYDPNYYAQMSAYNSGEATEIVYLITPGLNVTASSVLTFDTKLAYQVHDPASVLISTDFSGDVTTATWNTITYTHATAPSNGYGDWTASGDIDLSSYDGQTVYIAFLYTGGDPGATTTLQVDNVLVTNATVASTDVSVLNDFRIFPNPAVKSLNINSISNIRNITISNIIGQKIISVSDINTENYSINIENLTEGVYLINIINSDGTSNIAKFVKR